MLRQRLALIDSIWTLPVPVGETDWFWPMLHGALSWLLVVVAAALGAALLLLSTSVIAAPFNDALSAAVERIEGTLPPSSTSLAADLVRSVRIEGLKLGVYMAVMLPLLVLALVAPPLGAPILASAGFAVTVTYVAIDYTDWPAARRGRGIRARAAWARRHAGPLLGFGLAAWALLFVPGLNLLLMPAAVAGGTLLYLDLERSEASAQSHVGRQFPG